MEVLIPTTEEIDIVNASRAAAAEQLRGLGGFMLMEGPCSVDRGMLPTGQLAAEQHVGNLNQTTSELANINLLGRFVATKPRSNLGQTGIIHNPGGIEAYARAARNLVLSGISLCSEVMDESDFAIAGSRLTAAWVGARNADDTGPRYLLRPTSEDLEHGIHPLPSLVKNSVDGSSDSMLNAVATIKSDVPVTRSRLTLEGLKTVSTHANPYVGVILRGHQLQQPTANLEDFIFNEVTEARTKLDDEFGTDTVPLVYDISHAHARQQGGGEAGQLKVAGAIANLLRDGSLPIIGIMAETYMIGGNQAPDGLIPGLSLTDECIGEAKAIAMNRAFDEALNRSAVSLAVTTL